MSATDTFRIPFDTCPCRFERRRRPPEAQPSNRHSHFKFFEDLLLMKKLLLVTFIFLVAIIGACSSTNAPNSNTVSNSNTINIPPEFSNKPVTPSGNSTPGIPDPNSVNVNRIPQGITPTPGIPDPKTIGKTPVPKGATPTPGIPDPETLKRQMNQRITNANVINQIPKNQQELDKTVRDTLKDIRKKP
jgi:hypothetical protein